MHIICRGNNKQNIFKADKDKLYYRCLLRTFQKENKIIIYHYCLMDNHVHLIVWLGSESRISRFIKQVNLSYFHYYSKKYSYAGHLWQGRFKSNIVDTDSYLLQCGKYIELNPVRAGVVNLPQHYLFSSYNYYAKGIRDSLITPSPVYIGLSASEHERRTHYIEFVVDSSIICPGKLAKQLFIGSDTFVRKSQEYYAITSQKLKRGRPRKIETSPILDEKYIA